MPPDAPREAFPHDAREVAHLHRLVIRSCLPYLPELYTPEEDLWFFENRFFPEHRVWICGNDPITGYCGIREGWVSHLYVRPEFHGQGVGTRLLRKAMDSHPTLRLWVFQCNTRAICFYESHGFCLVEMTDGGRNEEKEPDALYAWSRQR
jgi:putative acetyltransferase